MTMEKPPPPADRSASGRHGASRRPGRLSVAAPTPGPGERRRVLVVDDEPGIRYMAARVLGRSYDVRDVATGEEALALLETEPFHFALVDVRLPGLSGLDLLSAMKLFCPSIDVIVMTGSAADVDEKMEDAIRRRAFFFLRKPFPMTVLETLAERVAETQELEERLVQYAWKLEQDLESARVFQRRLLPPRSWTGERIRIASVYNPFEKMGGDFFDYWTLPDGGTGILVADVMGHGPSTAMITGVVKSQIRSLSAEIMNPGDVLRALDEELSRIALSSFLTALLIFDRPGQEKVLYAGAGHPAALAQYAADRSDMRGSGTRSASGGAQDAGGDDDDQAGCGFLALESTGIPINTGLPVRGRETLTIPRESGLRLILYTDGYTDIRDREDRGFDEELPGSRAGATQFRLAAARALAEISPEAGLSSLEASWARFQQGAELEDDRAAVICWLH